MTNIQATAQDHTELELLLRGFMVPRMLRLVTDFGLADCVPPEGEVPVCDLAAAAAC